MTVLYTTHECDALLRAAADAERDAMGRCRAAPTNENMAAWVDAASRLKVAEIMYSGNMVALIESESES